MSTGDTAFVTGWPRQLHPPDEMAAQEPISETRLLRKLLKEKKVPQEPPQSLEGP